MAQNIHNAERFRYSFRWPRTLSNEDPSLFPKFELARRNLTMSQSQPVFVLAGGAWHTPAHYQPFLDVVAARGYKIIAPRLPSTIEGQTTGPVEADIKTLADIARELVDEGKEVVFIAHSAGGISAAEAAHGQGVRERSAKGLSGGVRSLVLVSALGALAGKQLEWDEESLARKGDAVMGVEVSYPAMLSFLITSGSSADFRG